MNSIKKNLTQALLWLMLGLVPQLAWAEVPNVINYQGYLTDSSGTPLEGTVNVTLKFWDALTGGNTIGSPKSYTNVNVNNGVFSQNVDVSDITFDNPVFIETTVNGETLAPRQLVTSVPFAYRAKKAADADKLGGLDSSDIEKLEKRIAELETENQRLQELTSPTSYVKTLMKAKHGNGDWDIFVTGPVGKSCSEICNSIRRPSACGGAKNTPMTGSCLALWSENHSIPRNMVPHADPYFNYGCYSLGVPNSKPMCMCNTGSCGWPDSLFSLPNGIEFW